MTGEAYHLIPLGTVILFFYALSLLLVRFSVFPRQQNRRFWNFLLLFFFCSTALLGLLLVIKVNYKLDKFQLDCHNKKWLLVQLEQLELLISSEWRGLEMP